MIRPSYNPKHAFRLFMALALRLSPDTECSMWGRRASSQIHSSVRPRNYFYLETAIHALANCYTSLSSGANTCSHDSSCIEPDSYPNINRYNGTNTHTDPNPSG